MKNEQIQKSVDELIEQFFTEEEVSTEEVVEKAKKDVVPESKDEGESDKPGPVETKADQVKAPKPKKDNSEGRPEDTQDVPDEDEDGKRAKGYEAVQKPNKAVPESNEKGTMVKAESDKIEITKEEFELLKKAKADREEEVLKKAKTEQADLIKAAVVSATEEIKKENETLKKSIQETQELVKAMAGKPQPSKAVTSIAALEKSFGSEQNPPAQERFSKAEILDAAEELCKSGAISVEQVIELENSGSASAEVKAAIEKQLKRKG
jgi:hypothetical protein